MAWKIEERDGKWVVIAADGAEAGPYAVKAAAQACMDIAAKGASFNDIRRRLEAWLNETYPPQKNGDGYPMGWSYVVDVWADSFVFCRDGEKNYRVSYALVGADLTVGEPVEVRQDWEEVKSADTIVYQGGAVKALGNGKVGGHLVVFGDAKNTDSSTFKDYFDAETDFDVDLPGAKSAVYYHHGQDDALGKRRLGKKGAKAELGVDEVGVWIEAQLDMRDDYEKAIYTLAEAGKMGWSSGTAAHLVEREAVKVNGKTVAHHIKHWPLGLDASLTPTPAEMKCQAVALKSLTVTPLAELAEAENVQISREEPSETKTLAEHARAVETACEGYAQRLESRLEARVKAGRVLSAANVAELEEVQSALDGLTALRDRVSALLEKARPKQDTEPEAKAAIEQARLEFSRLLHQTRDIAA